MPGARMVTDTSTILGLTRSDDRPCASRRWWRVRRRRKPPPRVQSPRLKTHARNAITLALTGTVVLIGMALGRTSRSELTSANLSSAIPAGSEIRCADRTLLRRLPDHPFFILPFKAEPAERWEVIPQAPAEGASSCCPWPRALVLPQAPDSFLQSTKKPR